MDIKTGRNVALTEIVFLLLMLFLIVLFVVMHVRAEMKIIWFLS